MAKPIKAKKPWHVVTKGYSPDDLLSIGRGDVYLQPGWNEGMIVWCRTRDEAMQHPAARDKTKNDQIKQKLNEVDNRYADKGIDRVQSHTAKSMMAVMYLKGMLGPDDDTSLLDDEAAMRGITPTEMAEVWLSKMRELYPKEIARVAEKKQVAEGS